MHPLVVFAQTRAETQFDGYALCGQGKGAICANKRYTSIDEQTATFIDYMAGLSNAQALHTAVVLSENLWLRRATSKKFAYLLRCRECKTAFAYEVEKKGKADVGETEN